MEPLKKLKKLDVFSSVKNIDFLSSDFILEIPIGGRCYVCEVNSDTPNVIRVGNFTNFMEGPLKPILEPIRVEVNRINNYTYTDFYEDLMDWMDNSRKVNMSLSRISSDGDVTSKWLLNGAFLSSYTLTPIDHEHNRIGFTLHFDHVTHIIL